MNEILPAAGRATPTVVRITTENFVLTATPNQTKKFDTDSQMYYWLSNSQSARDYKMGQIDWEKRTIRVEGRPINWK